MCDALKVCLVELARSTNVAKEYFKRQTLDSKPAQEKYVLIEIVIGCINTVGPSQTQIQHGPHFSRKRNV